MTRACDDCEDEIPTTTGSASVQSSAGDDDERVPGFMVPDPESRSCWRYYYVKRQRPGDPPRRQMGFR